MDVWDVSREPQGELTRWALQNGYLFSTPEWAHVLEGLGCNPLYAWNRNLQSGTVVPVFRRGPFKVGFFGFPIVGEVFDAFDSHEFTQLEQSLARAINCDLLRSVRSGIRVLEKSQTKAAPEVWIDDMQTWPGNRAKRLAKDVTYAIRATGGGHVLEAVDDADVAYSLYQQTVRSHGGKIRYTTEYFRRLLALSRSSGLLRAVSVVDKHGQIIGFAVMARNGGTAYYLHGAVDIGARSLGIADLLLSWLIEIAKASGARNFSLMASPPNQPGLIKYKQKWGNCEGFAVTNDVGNGLVGRSLAWLLRKR